MTITGHEYSNYTQYTNLPKGIHHQNRPQGFQATKVQYPTMHFPPTYYQGLFSPSLQLHPLVLKSVAGNIRVFQFC